MIEVEQLSLFTMLSPVPTAVAVCCMDGSRVDAAPAESWMQRLVQGGEYVSKVVRSGQVSLGLPGQPFEALLKDPGLWSR